MRLEKSSKISAALLLAQQAITFATKDGSNSFAGFKYTSAEKMVLLSRIALAEAGLAVSRIGSSFEILTSELLKLNSKFLILHAESGEIMESETQFVGYSKKGMPQDKALAVALTASLSYYLRDLLLIPRFTTEEAMECRKDYPNEMSQKTIQEKIDSVAKEAS